MCRIAARLRPNACRVALVLIVDDSVSNRDLVQTVMRYCGHDTVEYRGGDSAAEDVAVHRIVPKTGDLTALVDAIEETLSHAG